MSYTSELKNDLYETLPKKKKAKYLLAGIILSNSHIIFDQGQINFSIQSESTAYLRFFYQLMINYYHLKGEIQEHERTGFHKQKLRVLIYYNVGEFLDKLGCISKLGDFYYSPLLNDILFKKKKFKRAFLKGVFISCGSILDPHTKYHLELDSNNSTVTEVCVEVLRSLGINCSIGIRNRREIISLNDANSIGDFLALIGANRKYFELEDIKIFKQMRSDINRRINSETANINKTAQAASEQTSAIELLKAEDRYETLPAELKKVAELRVAHPTISISKLVEKADFKISRSTLHRRLKRIVELANEE